MPRPDYDRFVETILLSAYACEPGKGSEPEVGWQFLRAYLKMGYRVVLLTRSNNVATIRRSIPVQQLCQLRIVHFELVRPLRSLKKIVPFGTQLYYGLWQLKLRGVASQLSRETNFSCVHHITFAVDWLPVGVAIPWPETTKRIWGPIGGAEKCPKNLRNWLGVRGRIQEGLRTLVGGLGRKASNSRYRVWRPQVVAQNGATASLLRRRGIEVNCIEPNVFVSPEIFKPPVNVAPTAPPTNTQKIIGIGRLLPWKGWGIAIKSLQFLPDNFTLCIFGGGPDLSRLRKLSRKFGVHARVRFEGTVPREELAQQIRNSSVLVHPSLHEAAGAAVAEAVSVGIPVVTFAWGGAGEIASRSGYETVSVTSANPALDFALAIERAFPKPESTGLWLESRIVGLISHLLIGIKGV